jgi:hypothetical protein
MCWSITCRSKEHYIVAKTTKTKFWLFKDLAKIPKKHQHNLSTEALVVGSKIYAKTLDGQKIVKNTKNAGKLRIWQLNGQDIYNSKLHPRTRAAIADHYHRVFREDIVKSKLEPIHLGGRTLSISVDIYEIFRNTMPDIDNMWPLEKWFTDSLVDLGIIPDDSPKYITQNGQKTYKWVDSEDQCRYVFTICLI